MWITPDDDFIPLDDIEPPDLADLLIHLRRNAPALHAQAATDEHYATSSALGWAFRELGVLPAGELHPLAWLDTLSLVREIRTRLALALGEGR